MAVGASKETFVAGSGASAVSHLHAGKESTLVPQPPTSPYTGRPNGRSMASKASQASPQLPLSSKLHMSSGQTGKLTMGYGGPQSSMEKTAKLDLSYGPQGKLALTYQTAPLPSTPAPGKLALSFTSKGKLDVAYKNDYPPAPGKLALSFTPKGKLAVAYKNDFPTASTASTAPPKPGKLGLSFTPNGKLAVAYKNDFPPPPGKLALSFTPKGKLVVAYKNDYSTTSTTALPKPGKLALSFTSKGKLAVAYKNDFPPAPGKLALSFSPNGKLAVAYKNDYRAPSSTVTAAKLNVSRGPAGKLCLSYSKPLTFTQAQIITMMDTFNAMDLNKNGHIELSEFANCFKVLKLEMKAEEIEAVFNSFAVNGRFGTEEYLELIKEGLQAVGR